MTRALRSRILSITDCYSRTFPGHDLPW